MPTVVGGSIAHRFQSECGAKGSMIYGLCAFNTHCVLITDTDLVHAKSAANSTKATSEQVSAMWAASHYCNACTQEVYTGDFDLSSDHIPYKGVQIMEGIQAIEVKMPIAGLNPTALPPEEMMSALYGFKWSLDIKNWREQPFVRRSAPHIPPFVNQTMLGVVLFGDKITPSIINLFFNIFLIIFIYFDMLSTG